MKISACNQLEGMISAVNAEPVSTEVTIDLAGGDKIVAVVTSESAKKLGLAKGRKAIGLVKAPLVTLLTDAGGYKFSARNQLSGVVTNVTRGAVNSEVSLKLAGGSTISAVVTNEAVAELQLATGKNATALIKASYVIVGVAG
ncbi:MAG TPA: TOBE domain-containing protein [Burkholderiales bacterium]|nr:TOBE domain-containing protein [Burkholderiales bacterium]